MSTDDLPDSAFVTYLYAIVPEHAPEPPAGLVGLEGQPLRLLRDAGVAAVITQLPVELYAEAEINRRLGDLDWVGERGIAHERVLTWYADRGPVIPLALFSLHRDAERIRERLEQGAERFASTLRRLQGRREWGVRLYRNDAFGAEHVAAISPRLRELSEEMAAAGPGRRFLLGKKLDAMRDEEIRVAGAEVARSVFGELRELAEGAVAVPPPAATELPRPILLDAYFLVADANREPFERRVTEVAHRCLAIGIEPLYTGPWPFYHFAQEPDDGGT